MKLEEIEKKNVFEVPEGYFDKLPLVIQGRISASRKPVWYFPLVAFNLKYAVPILFVIWGSVFIIKSYYNPSAHEKELESVSSENLIAYLSESEISEDEIIQSVDVTQLDFRNAPSVQALDLTPKDLDKLSNDIENEYF